MVPRNVRKSPYLHTLSFKNKHNFESSKDRLNKKYWVNFSNFKIKTFCWSFFIAYELKLNFDWIVHAVLLVCAFAVGANGYCYFSWEINCFSKSSRVINIKNAGSRLDFPISKLSSFEFQVVFLATIFIMLHNAEEHCVTRQKRLQGSFENTIYKVILMNE